MLKVEKNCRCPWRKEKKLRGRQNSKSQGLYARWVAIGVKMLIWRVGIACHLKDAAVTVE